MQLIHQLRQTSLDAYRKLVESGKGSTRRWAAFETLYKHGPLTAAEVTHVASQAFGEGHYWKRLSELERMVVVQRVGNRKCSITGEPVELWDVIDKDPAQTLVKLKADKAKHGVSRPSGKRLETAINQLLMITKRSELELGVELQEPTEQLLFWLTSLLKKNSAKKKAKVHYLFKKAKPF
jgi:hypothetical protein